MAAHSKHKLSVKKVQALKEPGTYSDGGGLYLVVGNGYARSWIMRIQQRGKRHDIGLGSAHLVPLADARDMADEIRKHVKSGGAVETYINRTREEAEEVRTVERLSRAHFEENSTKLAKRTRDMWLSRLEQYVLPVIGHMPIEDVTPREIKRVLMPIWEKTPDTAHRVRSRLSQLFDWATVEGYYSKANPVAGMEKALGDNTRKTKHHVALPWAELPEFMKDLAEYNGSSARCLELIILTATRSIEARGAKWSEINLKEKVWTIPAERMKGKLDRRVEHRVPLSDAALAVLEKMRGLDDELIFPSPRGKVLSDMAFKSIYKRMDQNEITTHGFRSAFQDWTEDNAVADTMVADKSLAHKDDNQVRNAYARSDLFERRRALMNAWGSYCTEKTT